MSLLEANMKIVGELVNRANYRKVFRTPTVTTDEEFRVTLRRNDVPVTVFYKNGSTAWRSLLINDRFREAAVPKFSDIYLYCTLDPNEVVEYEIEY